ncbi:hypothetical protein [Agromyces sp. GXS1127]|uniref:hypothetical protein n=1 Tax=Agromyces sp. GXS1127 TaxID=3424181 RepID=UPI003D31E876
MAPHLGAALAGLEGSGPDAEQARQILGIVDAYATGFLVVWARSRADGRPAGSRGAEASAVADLRDLDTFDRGLDALIAGLDATLRQRFSETTDRHTR